MSLTVLPVSSLEKVFSDSDISAYKKSDFLPLLCGEKGAVQFAVSADEDCVLPFEIKCPIEYKAYIVKEIYSDTSRENSVENCTMLNNGREGFYPDSMCPIEGDTLTLKKDNLLCVRIELEGNIPGDHTVIFTLGENSAEVNVHVSAAALPEQTLICTNWFHTDCLMTWYKVDAFSEEYWRIVENYVRNAVAHGINMILTPLFTPPLDTEVGAERPTVQLVGVKRIQYGYAFDFTNFDRWVEMCLRCGVKYFELSHLFTQWGAKFAPKIMARTSTGDRQIFGWDNYSLSQGYKSFLRQFGQSLKEHTDSLGITDICRIHASDEPSKSSIRHYRCISAIMKEYFPAFKHIDALSDYEFYEEGLVDIPVPSESAIESFKDKVDELWTYYCCGPYENEYPNRFLFLPLIKMRIIGVLLWKYNCRGFLHWGFNFWYAQLSKRAVNPFKNTTADGNFPAGDGFIVYPGENGEPMTTIREKAFFSGVCDYTALQALENKAGRPAAEELLKRTLGDITFTSYPLEAEKFEEFRRELINAMDK